MVFEETRPGSRNGDCSFAERRIRIDTSLQPAIKVSVSLTSVPTPCSTIQRQGSPGA